MNRKSQLSSWDMTYIIIGYTIGSTILYLPKELVKICGTDAWIAAIVGSIYPIYILTVAVIISKKCPNNNILDLSVKYFGKVLGTVLNLGFLFSFSIYLNSTTATLSNFIRTTISSEVSKYLILIMLFITAVYCCSKDIVLLAKVNKLAFYVMIVSLLFTIEAFKDGTILNVQPIFTSSIKDITKGAAASAYANAGMEAALLFCPYLANKKSMLQGGIRAIVIDTIIYSYSVFITIYYLGPDIVIKGMWPFVMTNTSIELSIVNNFRFVFMMFWLVVVVKIVLDYSYASVYAFNKVFYSKKIISYIYIFIIFGTSLLYGNEVVKRQYLSIITPRLVIFDLLYTGIIAIMTIFKEGEHK